MKLHRNILIVGVIAVLSASTALTAEDPAPGSGGDTNSSASTETNSNNRYDQRSFQVIQQRNIFNPNRRAIRPRDTGPRVQVDYFKLNGTMSYEDKAYAFFDGNNGQFRNKTLGRSEKIGGYTIQDISNTSVKLAASSNQVINLHIGSLMRRENNGPWKLVTSGDIPAEPTGDSAEGSTENSSNFTPTGNGSVDDIMKRLMERREKENKDPATGNDKSNEKN